MLLDKVPPVSAREQYEDYRRRRAAATRGTFLSFSGHGDEDVYNASVPFQVDGRRCIAGRVEKRGSEDSRTMFFEQRGSAWVLVKDAPVLEHLQDPFVTFIGGELVLGGVYALWDDKGGLITYSTRFFAGRSLAGLALRAEGPERMKDVRLLELPDRRVAVFSRPQGQPMLDRFGCIAKIGFAVVDSLAAVGPASVAGAPLLDGHFLPTEWGGCNQLFNLANGLVGVIGHKSWGETVDGVFVIHYYAMAFAIDPRTRRMTQTKVIAARDDFPPGPQKNPRAMDVVFTSGIERLGSGRALLYAGLSDCREGVLEIEDPLDEYEGIAV
jgi:hypothetical protein